MDDGGERLHEWLSGSDTGSAAETDRQVAGKWLMGAANVAQQCLKAGLVDELRVHLVPVLLGADSRLTECPPDCESVSRRQHRCAEVLPRKCPGGCREHQRVRGDHRRGADENAVHNP